MAMPKRKNVVTKIRLHEVSLVDDGMNQHAEVVLMKMAPTPGDVHVPGPMGGDGFKRCEGCKSPRNCGKHGACRGFNAVKKIGKGAGASPEEDAAAAAEAQEHEEAMTKTLDELSKALTDAATLIDTKDGEIATLKKSLAERDEELKKAKATDGGEGDEDIFKGLTPKARELLETLQKKASESEGELEKMRTKAEEDSAIAKARTYGVGEAKVLGPLMVRVRKGKTTEADVATLEGAFTSAAALIKASPMFKTLGEGGSGDSEGTGLSGLEVVAAALRKADPKLSAAEAMTKATNDNPQLYNEYIAKRRQSAGAN